MTSTQEKRYSFDWLVLKVLVTKFLRYIRVLYRWDIDGRGSWETGKRDGDASFVNKDGDIRGRFSRRKNLRILRNLNDI